MVVGDQWWISANEDQCDISSRSDQQQHQRTYTITQADIDAGKVTNNFGRNTRSKERHHRYLRYYNDNNAPAETPASFNPSIALVKQLLYQERSERRCDPHTFAVTNREYHFGNAEWLVINWMTFSKSTLTTLAAELQPLYCQLHP
jgi:hypothetical protein